MLYYCMTSGSGDYDTTTIPLKAPLFYQKEDTEIYATSDDVSELLRGAWANISLIHVYILYLIEEHISLFQKTRIKFLCPQNISAAEIKKDFLEVQMYLKNAFLTELRKKDAQCKFILAPYMEANHWVLYVIDLRMSLVYEFDSVIQSPPNARNSEFSKVMKIPYNVYRSHLKGNAFKTSRPQLLHIRMECAQQCGGTECAYYVMRYMYEIVSFHSNCRGNLKEYLARLAAYNDVELDEIREQWAKFFRLNFLLKD
ncbi:uncharacterized protein LOC110691595 isoform X7 [Chenopodium quinoa]|uniref:uncharacterized protein LOC110691595 isoform X7 n=1 Tax=Chenopodium quinoa TaxID=63459 RepID=UPI000B779106|nr:uncharacterized protein LOC110691595 isoform X7 [Chenopodium quinoa]